ncbi:MAG: ammonia-forming cytochrome c nitrite reductase subunit c552 [Nitrospirota bacterium]
MKKRNYLILAMFVVIASVIVLLYGCPPSKIEPVRPVKIADGEIDPAKWGEAYPINYESWKKTEEPTPAGKSKYKRGWDTDKKIYDKLSEFPFLALLYNGWGFGIEYNESRGHAYMVKDQIDIDPSRVKPGGVCLSCKSPSVPNLKKELGPNYFKVSYKEAINMIPEKIRELGTACIDCHDNKDMSLKLSRDFLIAALKDMGVDPGKLTRQDMRSLVCAQCHVTYIIPRDKDMKPTGLFFPWQGSKWGNIRAENIIKKMRSDPAYGEWKQAVTGFKMAYIRHPEYELYADNSVHWKAGAACADCHMPYTKVGSYKIHDHRVMSPLKNDMKACMQCHTETAEWLKEQVIAIQDRTVSLMMRAGYATATVAKLLEITHKAQAEGKNIDKAIYDKAKDYSEEAFYRTNYIVAENSVGFHNPTEATRILGDAIAFATKAEGLLRQALTKAGVAVPLKVNLELEKYLNNRGEKKLKFDAKVELKDPFGIQDKF